RSAKSVWVRPQAPWAPTSCRSTLPLRLADPLFRMAPCDRASSPSTYGRMVTPDFAAPWRLEQRRLALPWFSSSTDGGRNGLVRLSPSDLVDRHHGRAPEGSSGSSRFQPAQISGLDHRLHHSKPPVTGYGRTSLGARLNATTGTPRSRGAAQPARARWSDPASLLARATAVLPQRLGADPRVTGTRSAGSGRSSITARATRLESI